jgi:DNA-binding SARP family transcriptional activator
MRSTVEIRVLGPLEVVSGTRSFAPRAHKQRALLANLVASSGAVVSDERLIEDLWPEGPPATARHALRVYVSELRKALPDGVLSTRPPGYMLELEPERIDVTRFERLLAAARDAFASEDKERAGDAVRDALALWRGPAYADFVYDPWAQTEIARLEELRQQALELRIEIDLALGRADVVAELEALASSNPLRERTHALLMRALYRAGRQSDALAHFQAARTTLLDELGLEPGPELRELQTAILRQDTELLAVAIPARPQRKLATVLVASLPNAAALESTLDPEAYAALLQTWLACATGAVVRHGGTVDKLSREIVTAVFGVPTAHEDDALRAARAARELQDVAAAIDVSPRIGIASGEILAGGNRLATGAAAVVAAQLQAKAEDSSILVDDATHRLTAEAARYESLDEDAGVFQLHEVSPVATAIARRFDAPLVGRTSELAALNELGARSEADLRTLSVVVHGPGGIGKTRLTREFVRGMSVTLRECRCLPYGERSGYAALRQLVGERDVMDEVLAGVDDAAIVVARLAPVWGEPGAAEDVPWAFRRVCEVLAARAPLVLFLDDLHWGDPLLLDAVEHVVARGEGPIVVLCVARDELLETRPELAGNAVPLEPLGVDEINELAQQLHADTLALPDESRVRLVAAAEGNPLFLEQLLAHAVETGSLEPPETLRALLAARLDRLGPGERALLERAAVIGRDGTLDELAELLEPAAAAGVAEHVRSLERRGLFSPAGADRFHFHHGLIEDVAYRSVPKELRADLHERYADLIATRDADDELVGFHLERAHRLLVDLGRDDRRVQRLADDAASRLGGAADRALRRNDVRTGVGLVERAISLIGDDKLDRGLLCEYGVALALGERPTAADTVLTRACESAERAGDHAAALRAKVELAARRLVQAPEGAPSAFLELAENAIPVLEQLQQERALGRIWMITAWIHGGMHGRNAARAEAAERALVYYRSAGWPAAACFSQIGAALYFGPATVTEAERRLDDLLSDVGDSRSEAELYAYLGGLKAMREQFDEGLKLVADARSRFEDLGQPIAIWRICAPVQAHVWRLAGARSEAAQLLRESCEQLDRLHNKALLATQAAELAEILCEEQQSREAERWLQTAEQSAAKDDVVASVSCLAVRAQLLANEQKLADAEAMARKAVAISETTDALNRRAYAELALGHILAAKGGEVEAATAASAALTLFTRKGNLAAAKQLREASAAASPA